MCGREIGRILIIAATLAVLFSDRPSSASDRDTYLEVCTAFVEQHLDDAAWREACLSAVAQYVAAHPPAVEDGDRAVRPSVPGDQIQPRREVVEDHREEISARLRAGEVAEVLVEFEVREIDEVTFERAFDGGRRRLSADDLQYKRIEYQRVKQRGLTGIADVEVLREFDNLAKSYVLVASESALATLLARRDVRAVYENRGYSMALGESLPLIEQPQAAVLGADGAGTAIAVLDTGVDYTIPPFNCTSPGVPSGCRVAATFEAAPNDSMLDANGHGTNVSAIASGTAPAADIVVADVFTGSTAFWVDVIDAVNWAISNQATFNIVAMNVSIYDGSVRYLNDCPGHALASDFANALAAGIEPIISAGNDAYESGGVS